MILGSLQIKDETRFIERMLSGLKLGTEKYPPLTGVRAVGAIVVFLDHFPIAPEAHITINVMAFFYALSGFLIVRIYYDQCTLTRQWLSKYFINRFARIYPVYFLLLTIAIFLQRTVPLKTLITNYTLTHALFHPAQMIIQASWSLTVEETFYALAPLFMLLAHLRGYWAAFALAALLSVIAFTVSGLPMAFLHSWPFVLSTTFFGHFIEFFAGVYVALALMRLEKSGSAPVAGARFTLLGVIGVTTVVILDIMVYRHRPFHAATAALLNNAALPVPIGILYWGLLREKTILSQLLATRVFGLLGRSSYSFYLMHTLIIDYVSIPWLLPRMESRAGCVLLTLVGTWLLSIALFLFFEEPVNLSVRRLFQSKTPLVGMQATLYR